MAGMSAVEMAGSLVGLWAGGNSRSPNHIVVMAATCSSRTISLNFGLGAKPSSNTLANVNSLVEIDSIVTRTTYL